MVAAGLVTAERVAAVAMVGQFLILVVAARYAGRQVKGIRAQVDEARELRLAQARPFVVVDFEPEQHPFMNLVVANLGTTMARDVRIEVDPPFASTLDPDASVPLAELKLFTEGIPSLAPGKRIVLLFDVVPNRKEAGLPDTYHVRLHYAGEAGRSFTDDQRLDLDMYRPLKNIQRRTVHDVHKELDQIRRRLDSWSATPWGALQVVTPHERRKLEAELLEEQEAADGDPRPRLPVRLLGVLRRLVGFA
jgi:hypothetical protein